VIGGCEGGCKTTFEIACSSRHFFTGAVLALSVLHGAILDYLKHIMKSTNIPYLTPEGAVSGDCDLSANMYALVKTG